MENNQVIGSTQFTQNSIIDILIEKDANFRQSVENSAIKEITTTFNKGAQGFISYVHIVKIELQNGQIFEYALKFPSIEYLISKGENSQDNIQKIAKKNKTVCLVHNLECQFYTLFSGNSCPIPIPKVFFIKPAESSFKEGLIVMENLAKEGMVCKKYEFLEEEKIWVIIENIAKFQAFLLHNQEKIQWKGKFLECDYPNVNLRKRVEKLKTVFPEGMASNELIGFIDWSLTFEGNPLFDLARILVLSTEYGIRRKIESSLIEFYSEKLETSLGEYGAQLNFDRLQLQKAYNFSMVHQAMCSAGYLSSTKFKDEQEKIEIQHVAKNIEEALIDAVNLLKNGYF
uniref:CHK kinase-like domain-containing protein n=1 Tax=Acrobeloides nanus TaxID=290746 RepID=A0A914C5V5_9BILA